MRGMFRYRPLSLAFPEPAHPEEPFRLRFAAPLGIFFPAPLR